MNKSIKGSLVLLLLGLVLLFLWQSNSKKEPIALTPEELIETIKAENIDSYPMDLKESKPIFNMVDNLDRLEFYKMKAIETEKILMVYFYSNGCYFCEKMKNITFADTRVQNELINNYIAVSINYSKHKEKFREDFPLRATPAIVFFDNKSKELDEQISYGYQGAEDFYNRLELLAEPF